MSKETFFQTLLMECAHRDNTSDVLILNALESVDKGCFVPDQHRTAAYTTRPFKQGNFHISAAHMYVIVLNALELKKGVSFLNIGSGSGYLSCLVAHIVGLNCINHGIEIHDDLVKHSTECVARWIAQHTSEPNIGNYPSSDCSTSSAVRSNISFFHGNCFHLDVAQVLSVTGKYDRIYVGAGCPDDLKTFFYPLLAIGGILVLPTSDTGELLKVKRETVAIYTTEVVSHCQFAPLLGASNIDGCLDVARLAAESEFKAAEQALRTALHSSTRSLSLVGNASFEDKKHKIDMHCRVAPLLRDLKNTDYLLEEAISVDNPAPMKFRLSGVVWTPDKQIHRLFPAVFRAAVFSVLLSCRYSSRGPSGGGQSVDSQRHGRQQAVAHVKAGFGSLSQDTWMLVLSFCGRDWFNPPIAPLELVSHELVRCAAQMDRAVSAATVAKAERDDSVRSEREALHRNYILEKEVQRLKRRVNDLEGAARDAQISAGRNVVDLTADSDWKTASSNTNGSSSSGEESGSEGSEGMESDSEEEEEEEEKEQEEEEQE